MTNSYPDFFANRSEPWSFADVLAFIRSHFDVKENFSFRIGERKNDPTEHQGAGLVFVYAQLMDYTFNQVKALFSEHDHFAIAIPKSREGKNILEFNKIFAKLLQEGQPYDIKINQFPELFEIPKDLLTLKK